MDSVEKRVIRWKRHLIASSIVLTDDAIEKLVARGLMWSDTLDQIKGDFSNFGRMWKYLELLMNASIDHSAFESFCDFLEDQHPWLGEELRVELMVEKHQLEVDEYMRKEASQLVHRFFGTNKKISERDKKRLEDLVAVRAQVAKEVWRRTMDGTRRSLALQTTSKQEREEKLDAMIRNVEDFVDAQKKKISKYSLDAFRSDKAPAALVKRDSEISKRYSNIGAASHQVYQLEAAIEKLELVTTMCVLDFEGLREEKSRALELLGVEDEDAPIDKEVKSAVAKMTAQVNKAETRANAEEQKLRQVEQQLDEAKKRYEEHLKERDHNIRFLASSLEKAQEKFSISETELCEANDQLEAANAELAKFKVKSRYLEKTRHYGYGYFSDGYPADHKGATTARGELPRIGGSPRRQVGHQSPNANRKIVTRRPPNKSGQSV